MFEQIVTAGKANRARSVVLAVILQAIALGILIIVPLLFVQQLPEMQQLSFLVAPPPPPPPPPPPAGRAAAARPVRTVVTPKIFNPDHLTEPKTIPSVVAANQPEIAPPEVQGGVLGGVPGGVAGGQIGGVLGGVIGGLPQAAPPPPPPPPPQQAEAPKPTPERIRVGGQVEAFKLEHEVLPAYPALASQARVQGVVRLSAIIGKDGHVENLKVISGHPLLISSALEAVRQWVY
jgi:protein TonB